MYSVVASDLDGTLLSPAHTLTPYTQKVLKALVKKGIHFVFATGRHHVDVAQIRESLGIDAYMVTSNGARIHAPNGDLVHANDLSPEVAKGLFTIAQKTPQISTNVYRGDDWLTDRVQEGAGAFLQSSVFPHQVVDMKTLEPKDIVKVYFTSMDFEAMQALEKEINEAYGDKVNASFSLPFCLEVMAGEVSKGHALSLVTEQMGYSLEDCITFGDGMNDVEMLQMAGKGCIMGQGQQRLKDTLPHLEIIGSNADDAVANYLKAAYLDK